MKSRVIKILSALLAAAVVFTIAGCSSESKGNSTEEGRGDSVSPSAGSPVNADSVDGAGGADGDDGFPSVDEAESFSDGAVEWDSAADWNGESDYRSDVQPQAGLLTGGEWRDNLNWDDWLDLLQRDEWAALRGKWQLSPDNRLTVHVANGGVNIKGAKVTLESAGGVLWITFTDHNGTAYLFNDISDKDSDNAKRITVETNAQSKTIELVENYGGHIEVDISGASPAKKLDLMLVCDTTGSMGDEIAYLQSELENVAETVNRNLLQAPLRLSVNFYRDAGDDYVVLPYDFTTDISAATAALKEQSAAGGGDYPEAVELALENAVNGHDWDGESVKILLLVLDAPPHHNQNTTAAVKTIMRDAAAKGIRIIPVASSGVDTETEFLMRCLAAATGGTYTFLTDHSGIGNPHAEPTIRNYEVEKLNEMLIRIIGEYLG